MHKGARALYQDTRVWHLVFFVAVVSFVLLSFARIHQIVADDDLWALSMASRVNEGVGERAAAMQWFYFNPHLFIYCVALAFKIFGAGAAAARAVGIVSGAASACLVFAIVKASCPGAEAARVRLAAITGALYALAPTTIQNTVTIGIDNTILVPLTLCIVLAMIGYVRTRGARWALAVSCAVAAALWARLSTPLILVVILFVLTILSSYPVAVKRALVGSLIGGLALFAATWALYCGLTGASFLGPCRYLLQAGGGWTRYLAPGQIVQNAAYLALWLGIFFLPALAVVVCVKRRALFRDLQISPHLILLSGCILFAGFSFFGGTSFGFCRYHAPAIPLLYIGIALAAAPADFEGLAGRKALTFFAVAAFIHLFIVRDLLYVLRYTLRDYQAFGYPASLADLRGACVRVVVAAAAYGALYIVYRRIGPRKALPGILIVLAAISALTTTAYQSVAAYNTGYNYGERGAADVVRYIREAVPRDRAIIAPGEVAYCMGLGESSRFHASFWDDRNALARRVADPRVAAFVYSVTCNTVGQIRMIARDPAIQDALREGYGYRKLGSYDVWVRR